MYTQTITSKIKYYNSLYKKYKHTYPIFAQRSLERKQELFIEYNSIVKYATV